MDRHESGPAAESGRGFACPRGARHGSHAFTCRKRRVTRRDNGSIQGPPVRSFPNLRNVSRRRWPLAVAADPRDSAAAIVLGVHRAGARDVALDAGRSPLNESLVQRSRDSLLRARRGCGSPHRRWRSTQRPSSDPRGRRCASRMSARSASRSRSTGSPPLAFENAPRASRVSCAWWRCCATAAGRHVACLFNNGEIEQLLDARRQAVLRWSSRRCCSACSCWPAIVPAAATADREAQGASERDRLARADAGAPLAAPRRARPTRPAPERSAISASTGCSTSSSARTRSAQDGDVRPPDRIAEPHAVSRAVPARGVGARRAADRWRCCSSISIASRPSTTQWATRSATNAARHQPAAVRPCANGTWCVATRATSSRCCCGCGPWDGRRHRRAHVACRRDAAAAGARHARPGPQSPKSGLGEPRYRPVPARWRRLRNAAAPRRPRDVRVQATRTRALQLLHAELNERVFIARRART